MLHILVFTLVVILASLYILYQRFLSPLASIPGPVEASLSRLWLIKHTWKGDMHREMLKLHAKHGKLVRTGPNEVSITDLNAIKKIYGPFGSSLCNENGLIK
jgi:hypothetical protein